MSLCSLTHIHPLSLSDLCPISVCVVPRYAEVVVSTEESFRRLLEAMPQCKIHGEKLECRFASKRNLSEFEALSRKRT